MMMVRNISSVGMGDHVGDSLELSRIAAKNDARRILEILCLNFSLDGVNLCPTMRKPFDALAKGLSVHSGRGGRVIIERFIAEVYMLPLDIQHILIAA